MVSALIVSFEVVPTVDTLLNPVTASIIPYMSTSFESIEIEAMPYTVFAIRMPEDSISILLKFRLNLMSLFPI